MIVMQQLVKQLCVQKCPTCWEQLDRTDHWNLKSILCNPRMKNYFSKCKNDWIHFFFQPRKNSGKHQILGKLSRSRQKQQFVSKLCRDVYLPWRHFQCKSKYWFFQGWITVNNYSVLRYVKSNSSFVKKKIYYIYYIYWSHFSLFTITIFCYALLNFF